jgi:predicted naringenin-chalcone synthase
MAFIQSIGLCKAPFKHAQSDIFSFMNKVYDIPHSDSEKVKRLYDRSEIDTRYSAIEDFSLAPKDWTFLDEHKKASVEKRMQTYFDIAPSLCQKAILDCINDESELQTITHLITVSCTGMSAPGLDIQLMQRMNLSTRIHRTSINFMGCYAAIHALKQANAICKADAEAKVLIVSVELCTLHFQSDYSMDNVASSLLFGDGCAAVLVGNQKGIYEIEKFYSEVAFQGYHDMAWHISSNGFLMSLSSFVPNIIAENIKPMLENSLTSMSISQTDIQHWAIHPGGKKIVTEVQKVCCLRDEDVDVSRQILKDFGNMSSATILFVLHKMKSTITQANERVYAVAFGPGLTIESMFLTSC